MWPTRRSSCERRLLTEVKVRPQPAALNISGPPERLRACSSDPYQTHGSQPSPPKKILRCFEEPLVAFQYVKAFTRADSLVLPGSRRPPAYKARISAWVRSQCGSYRVHVTSLHGANTGHATLQPLGATTCSRRSAQGAECFHCVVEQVPCAIAQGPLTAGALAAAVQGRRHDARQRTGS